MRRGEERERKVGRGKGRERELAEREYSFCWLLRVQAGAPAISACQLVGERSARMCEFWVALRRNRRDAVRESLCCIDRTHNAGELHAVIKS